VNFFVNDAARYYTKSVKVHCTALPRDVVSH